MNFYSNVKVIFGLIAKIFLCLISFILRAIAALNRWLLKKSTFSKLIIVSLILLATLALFARYSYYLEFPYLSYAGSIGLKQTAADFIGRAQKTAFDGGFLLTQLGTLEHGQSNTSLVAILAFIFRYWGLYPGLHYYALLTVILGSFMCFIPYLIISKIDYGASVGGLLTGYLLAIHPFLINWTHRMSIAFFWIFLLSLYLLIYYLALIRFNYKYLIFLGVISAFTPYARKVFGALVPFMLILFFLSTANLPAFFRDLFKGRFQRKNLNTLFKAFLPIFLFIILFGSFEPILYKVIGSNFSIYLHDRFIAPFFSTNSDALVVYTPRQGDFSLFQGKNLWTSLISYIPSGVEGVFYGIKAEIFRQNIFYFYGIVLTAIMFVIIMFKKKRFFTPLWWLTYLYFFMLILIWSAMSGTLKGGTLRQYMPLAVFFFLMAGFVAGFIDIPLKWLNKIPRIRLSPRSITLFKRYMLIALLLIFCFNLKIKLAQTYQVINDNNKKKKYLIWAGEVLPKEALVLLVQENNPWYIYELINRPVAYDIGIRYNESQGIYIDKLPYLVKDYMMIGERVGTKLPSEIFFKFIDEGYKLFVLDEATLNIMKIYYVDSPTSLHVRGSEKFELVLYKEYNRDLNQAIYQLERK